MRLAIDASNIRAGGGLTHLRELLSSADPVRHGFERVVVWASGKTLDVLPERAWLERRSSSWIDRGGVPTALWQWLRLGREVNTAGCDVLFVPGGSFATAFRPVISMSQNLLPFDWRELRRYGLSLMTLKMIALRLTQGRSFRRAQGTVFLTDAARRKVLEVTGQLRGAEAVIPHGVDARFFMPPRQPRDLAECSDANPFRVIYVSAVEPYKHQWNVARAVATLRAQGLPVSLDLIGPANPTTLPKLLNVLAEVDPSGTAIRYVGALPYEQLHARYQGADLCVFASSCETIANILIEGMAAGVPTVASSIPVLREVLSEAGEYFDPEDPENIALTIETMLRSPALRVTKAWSSFELANSYSWQRCADETFAFLWVAAKDSVSD